MFKKENTLILLLIITLFSCKEEELELKSNGIDLESDFYIKDGIFHFQDDKAVANYREKIRQYTDEELINFENSIGFTSLYNEINCAYDALGSVKDESQARLLIPKFSDILELNSDRIISPKITNTSIQKILNRGGVYFSGNKKFTVNNNVLAISDESVSEEEIKNQIDGYRNSKISSRQISKDITLHSLGEKNNTAPLKRVLEPIEGSGPSYPNPDPYTGDLDCNHIHNDNMHWYIARNVYWGDDRMVQFSLGVKNDIYTLTYTKRITPMVIMRSRSYKKFFGGWINYKTSHRVRNVSIDFTYKGSRRQRLWEGNITREDWWLYESPIGDSYEVDIQQSDADYYADFEEIEIHSIYGELTTRGIGNNWAVIDCTF
jgi:hypothetical protein